MSAKKPDSSAKRLRELECCVLDLCALLDVVGEAADFGDADSAIHYFCTVSKNIGLARVVIERNRGRSYYNQRFNIYAPVILGATNPLPRRLEKEIMEWCIVDANSSGGIDIRKPTTDEAPLIKYIEETIIADGFDRGHGRGLWLFGQKFSEQLKQETQDK